MSFNFLATITFQSDFGAQENKIRCFYFSLSYLPWSDGTRCHDLSFFNVEFQASKESDMTEQLTLSLSKPAFHPHKCHHKWSYEKEPEETLTAGEKMMWPRRQRLKECGHKPRKPRATISWKRQEIDAPSGAYQPWCLVSTLTLT